MANNSTHLFMVSSDILLVSILFKFIAMGIGVMGNIAVLICNIYIVKDKTAATYLIANLAASDLLVCLTFYPMWIIEFIQTVLNIDSDQILFCKLSRASSWALLLVSIATLFAITVDRYLFIVKPLKYPMFVTRSRTLKVIVGIWVAGCGFFVMHELNYRNYPKYRSLCYESYYLGWFTTIFTGYIPLTLLFILNFKILTVAREQRKRIQLAAELTVESISQTNDERPANTVMTFRHRILSAWKGVKTFIIIVLVLAFCCLIPTIAGRTLILICSESCQQVWYVVLNYELYGINSIVNPFIYGIRHVKYRRAYEHIIFKLLRCNLPRTS